MLAVLDLATSWKSFDEDPGAGAGDLKQRGYAWAYAQPYSRSWSCAHGQLVGQAIAFEPTHDSPGEARRSVVRALRRRDCRDELIQDAGLLVTELAANAVVHARSSFSVAIGLHSSTLRIEVADGGRMTAAQAGQDWVPRQGHGLGLIDAICVRWGADITAKGKVVWGELSLLEPPAH